MSTSTSRRKEEEEMNFSSPIPTQTNMMNNDSTTTTTTTTTTSTLTSTSTSTSTSTPSSNSISTTIRTNARIMPKSTPLPTTIITATSTFHSEVCRGDKRGRRFIHRGISFLGTIRKLMAVVLLGIGATLFVTGGGNNWVGSSESSGGETGDRGFGWGRHMKKRRRMRKRHHVGVLADDSRSEHGNEPIFEGGEGIILRVSMETVGSGVQTRNTSSIESSESETVNTGGTGREREQKQAQKQLRQAATNETMCGCPSCTSSVLDDSTVGGENSMSCRDRITWIMEHWNLPMTESCVFAVSGVKDQFSSQCGVACDPTTCLDNAVAAEDVVLTGVATAADLALTPTTMCGCSTCTPSVLDTDVDTGLSCRERIEWIKDNWNLPEAESCSMAVSGVEGQFESTCGPECDPDQCKEKESATESVSAITGAVVLTGSLCGCSTCTSGVLNDNLINGTGMSCRDRISWIVQNWLVSQKTACRYAVSGIPGQFPPTCGLECDPDTCDLLSLDEVGSSQLANLTDLLSSVPSSASRTPSFAPSVSPTPAPTSRPSLKASPGPSAAISGAPSPSPTVTPTARPTNSPTMAPTPSPTSSPTAKPTSSPSASPTSSHSFLPTASPSRAPSIVFSPLPTVTLSTFPSRTFTISPTDLHSVLPTVVATDTPTATASNTPTLHATDNPTATQSNVPTLKTSDVPSRIQSISPTNLHSYAPSTSFPTASPSLSSHPSGKPSASPTSAASSRPSISWSPSTAPSRIPTLYHSNAPSVSYFPTLKPSFTPTHVPTTLPSAFPSALPSIVPSEQPSLLPSVTPTLIPTSVPSSTPTGQPSSEPSASPTSSMQPSALPSLSPTSEPSLSPSSSPSMNPTPWASYFETEASIVLYNVRSKMNDMTEKTPMNTIANMTGIGSETKTTNTTAPRTAKTLGRTGSENEISTFETIVRNFIQANLPEDNAFLGGNVDYEVEITTVTVLSQTLSLNEDDNDSADDIAGHVFIHSSNRSHHDSTKEEMYNLMIAMRIGGFVHPHKPPSGFTFPEYALDGLIRQYPNFARSLVDSGLPLFANLDIKALDDGDVGALERGPDAGGSGGDENWWTPGRVVMMSALSALLVCLGIVIAAVMAIRYKTRREQITEVQEDNLLDLNNNQSPAPSPPPSPPSEAMVIDRRSPAWQFWKRKKQQSVSQIVDDNQIVPVDEEEEARRQQQRLMESAFQDVVVPGGDGDKCTKVMIGDNAVAAVTAAAAAVPRHGNRGHNDDGLDEDEDDGSTLGTSTLGNSTMASAFPDFPPMSEGESTCQDGRDSSATSSPQRRSHMKNTIGSASAEAGAKSSGAAILSSKLKKLKNPQESLDSPFSDVFDDIDGEDVGAVARAGADADVGGGKDMKDSGEKSVERGPEDHYNDDDNIDHGGGSEAARPSSTGSWDDDNSVDNVRRREDDRGPENQTHGNSTWTSSIGDGDYDDDDDDDYDGGRGERASRTSSVSDISGDIDLL